MAFTIKELQEIKQKITNIDNLIISHRNAFHKDTEPNHEDLAILDQLTKKSTEATVLLSKQKKITYASLLAQKKITKNKITDLEDLEDKKKKVEELRVKANKITDNAKRTKANKIKITQEKKETIDAYIKSAKDFLNSFKDAADPVKQAFDAEYPEYVENLKKSKNKYAKLEITYSIDSAAQENLLTGMVIDYTGKKTKSEPNAKASIKSISDNKEAINTAAKKYHISGNLLAAIMSRETGDQATLESLDMLGITPEKQFDNIRDIIIKNKNYKLGSKEEYNLFIKDKQKLDEDKQNLDEEEQKLEEEEKKLDEKEKKLDEKEKKLDEKARTDLEKARTDLEKARTDLEKARTDLEKARTDLKEARKTAFETKYGTYSITEFPGLNKTDAVWGTDETGFGITQLDIKFHAMKVLNLLQKKTRKAVRDASLEFTAGILAHDLETVINNRPNWSAAEHLQAAIAAYNGGANGVYGDITAFDAETINGKTTDGDYSNDVITRAQYFHNNPVLDGTTTEQNTEVSPKIEETDKTKATTEQNTEVSPKIEETDKTKATTEQNTEVSQKTKKSDKAKIRKTMHKVVSGDTLSGLAETYGVKVDYIKALNGLKGNLIEGGQELLVKKIYTVISGESLFQIGRKPNINMTTDTLIKLNGLKSETIQIKQQLLVY